MAKKPAVPKPKTPNTIPSVTASTLPSCQRVASAINELAEACGVLDREARSAYRKGPVTAARAFVVVHRLEAKLEEASKVLKGTFNRMKTRDIPTLFDERGLPNLPLEEGFRVGCNSLLYASVRGDRKDEAFEWLRAHGAEDLIVETVNASTLSAFARHLDKEENRTLPDDLFSSEYIPSTSVTSTSKKD